MSFFLFFFFFLLPSRYSNTVNLDHIYPKSNVGLPAASPSPTHHSQATNHHLLHQPSPWQRGRRSWHSSPFQSWWHRRGNNERFIHPIMVKRIFLPPPLFGQGHWAPETSYTVNSFIQQFLFFVATLAPKCMWIMQLEYHLHHIQNLK